MYSLGLGNIVAFRDFCHFLLVQVGTFAGGSVALDVFIE